MKGGNCYHCGSALTALDYGREDICRKCGKDSRTCRNCQFHDRSAHNECHETQADRVVEKEKANFCDYFKPSDRAGTNAVSKDALKSAADSLFKKKSD